MYVDLYFNFMSKHTKKVGLVGKYGTRYGSSIRKHLKKIEVSQHQKYVCSFCGKKKIERISVGIWSCKGCYRTVSGGAWTLCTQAAITTRGTIRRLRELL
jgi:large subunit ribosomal protein L37Ae